MNDWGRVAIASGSAYSIYGLCDQLILDVGTGSL